MPNGSRFSVGCCCTAEHGPPFCNATILLLDCDATPIAGATVESLSAGSVVTAGATDGSGLYTFPPGSGPDIRITWDGCSATFSGANTLSLFNCTNTIRFCYRHASVAVATPSAAGDVLTVGSSVPWVQTDDGAGNFLLTYKAIQYCYMSSRLPSSVSLYAANPGDSPFTYLPSGYLPICATVTVHCGDGLVVDFGGQYHFDPCYSYGLVNPGYNLCPDDGCDLVANPPGPLRHGLLPRTIQVRLTTLSKPCGTWFAADEGSWITLTLSVWTTGAFGVPLTYAYDSGCRDGRGNFVPFGQGCDFLNCPLPYTANQPYPSTRVLMILSNAGLGPVNSFGYYRYNAAGCVNNTALPLPVCVTLDNALPVPCTVADFTYTHINPTSAVAEWTAEVREVAC